LNANFLSGAGELGKLIQAIDWSGTTLGPLEDWSTPVITTLGIVLNSSVPMVTLWGEDGIMIYNEAYSRLAGGRHPGLLGQPVRQGWPEVAGFNDRVMKMVLSGGVLSYRDQEMRLNRSGVPEQVWMNLDYSPVLDPAGVPIGVISIVVETTGRVLAERQRKLNEERLEAERARQRQLFEQAPGFVIIMRGPNHIVEFVNNVHRQLFNSESWVGKPLAEAVPSLKTPGRSKILDDVYATGKAVTVQGGEVSYERLPGLAQEVHFLTYTHAPMYAEDGTINGIFCEGFDVTAAECQRRRAEAIDRLVARLSDLDDPDQLGRVVAEFAAAEVGANRAGFGLVDNEQQQINLLPEWAASGLGKLDIVMPFDRLADKIDTLRRGEVIMVSDLAEHGASAAAKSWLNAMQIRSALSIPVMERGQLVAVLFVNDGKARHWTDDEIDFLTRVAERSRVAVERRRAEARLRASESRLRFLDALSRETAGATDSRSILADTTRMLGEYLGATVCDYADVDADGEGLTVLGEWRAAGAISLLGRHHLSSFGAGGALRAGLPLVVRDTSELPAEMAAAYRRLNIGAVVCMPLTRDGRLTSLMAIKDNVPRDWSEDEIALLREVTSRSWSHLERLRLEHGRRDIEPRLRAGAPSVARL
jgi:GAF domain-containing protein/PAS domain-containing protein